MKSIELNNQLHIKLPTNKKRVAVIEIGSRAVRMLVADVGDDIYLYPILTDYKQTQLLDSLRSTNHDLESIIFATKCLANEMSERAKSVGAREILIIGTAACRELVKEHLGIVEKIFPELLVFSGKSEAICSGIASIDWDKKTSASQRIITIDHGAGSMEILVALRKGRDFRVEDHRSYKLGSSELKLMLKKCDGDIDQYSKLISKRISSYKFVVQGHANEVVGLGSVLTKTAWLFIRDSLQDSYSPKRVHGHSLDLLTIRKVVRDISLMASNDIQKLREFIEPRRPNSDEFEIVISGLVAIGFLLEKLNANKISVTTYGVRHGLALLLGSQQVNGIDFQEPLT